MWGFGDVVEGDTISLGPIVVEAPRSHEEKVKSREQHILDKQNAMCMPGIAQIAGATASLPHRATWYDMTFDDNDEEVDISSSMERVDVDTWRLLCEEVDILSSMERLDDDNWRLLC